MKSKKIIIMIIIILSLIFQRNIVQAALQANGSEGAEKDRDTWMIEIRQMETLGETLGLEETLNETDLTSTTESNKLDIHLQKNTEYGAMALLSASPYGNPVKIEDGETTTGNPTGVVIPYLSEWTAAQYTDMLGKTDYADRYINYYNINGGVVQKSGDATEETMGWHETSYLYYYLQRGGDHGLRFTPGGIVREEEDGIFGFNNDCRIPYRQ